MRKIDRSHLVVVAGETRRMVAKAIGNAAPNMTACRAAVAGSRRRGAQQRHTDQYGADEGAESR